MQQIQEREEKFLKNMALFEEIQNRRNSNYSNHFEHNKLHNKKKAKKKESKKKTVFPTN